MSTLLNPGECLRQVHGNFSHLEAGITTEGKYDGCEIAWFSEHR